MEDDAALRRRSDLPARIVQGRPAQQEKQLTCETIAADDRYKMPPREQQVGREIKKTFQETEEKTKTRHDAIAKRMTEKRKETRKKQKSKNRNKNGAERWKQNTKEEQGTIHSRERQIRKKQGTQQDNRKQNQLRSCLPASGQQGSNTRGKTTETSRRRGKEAQKNTSPQHKDKPRRSRARELHNTR